MSQATVDEDDDEDEEEDNEEEEEEESENGAEGYGSSSEESGVYALPHYVSMKLCPLLYFFYFLFTTPAHYRSLAFPCSIPLPTHSLSLFLLPSS